MSDLDKNKFPLFKELEKNGFIKLNLPFPSAMREAISISDWSSVDQLIYEYLSNQGYLREVLDKCHPFLYTEHIIALRDAKTDEDGIWHDDGSRHFAFTWSMNDDDTLQGGELLFRKKTCKNDTLTIPAPPSETLIIFLTGEFGYEHKVNKVTKGIRKTIAGWCSTTPPLIFT